MSFVKPAINHTHNLGANNCISCAHINHLTHFFSCCVQIEQPREVQTGTSKGKNSESYDKPYSTFTSSCFAHTGLLQLALSLFPVLLAHIQNARRMHENTFKKTDVVFLELDFIQNKIICFSPIFFSILIYLQ